jgi:two-component sensor histidine kinase
MLHELRTNAVKYGGLSNEDGMVEIHWTCNEADAVIDFVWQERGGPAVTPPAHRGFGSTLIEQGLAHDPRNRVEICYPQEGLVCRARIVPE